MTFESWIYRFWWSHDTFFVGPRDVHTLFVAKECPLVIWITLFTTVEHETNENISINWSKIDDNGRNLCENKMKKEKNKNKRNKETRTLHV